MKIMRLLYHGKTPGRDSVKDYFHIVNYVWRDS